MLHLLFACDTLIFCEANHEHLCYMRGLLCFETVSGLKINLSKLEFVHVGDVDDCRAFGVRPLTDSG